jgi:endoglucanase
VDPLGASPGRNIARGVLRLLTVRLEGNLLLLPAAAGFERPENAVLNPSYYVFPAFVLLAPLAPSAV